MLKKRAHGGETWRLLFVCWYKPYSGSECHALPTRVEYPQGVLMQQAKKKICHVSYNRPRSPDIILQWQNDQCQVDTDHFAENVQPTHSDLWGKVVLIDTICLNHALSLEYLLWQPALTKQL